MLGLVFLPAAAVLVAATLVAVIGGVDVGSIVRDPASVLDGHPLVGALSQLGVIIWWVTASVCLFSFLVALKWGAPRATLVFLLTSGLLTAWLAVDDQFLIHDDLASRYLGLRERHVMAVLLVLAAGWFLANLRVIRRTEWGLLAVSLGLLAASIATDLAVQTFADDLSTIGSGLDWSLLLEDGLKFMGIVGWSAYLVRFSYFTLTDQPDRPGTDGYVGTT